MILQAIAKISYILKNSVDFKHFSSAEAFLEEEGDQMNGTNLQT